MSSKKIGSKLAESLRQVRNNPPAEVIAPHHPAVATATVPSMPVCAPRADDPAPAASHGILHPRRIWPD